MLRNHILLSMVVLASLTTVAFSEVVAQGDVDASALQSYGTAVFIGNAGTGEVLVSGGEQLGFFSGVVLGNQPGSSGTLSLDGDSTYLHSGSVIVGDDGQGQLNLSNNASIFTGITQTGYGSGSGTINFDGGQLDTGTLIASPASLNGSGTINAKSIVSDMDIYITSPGQLTQTITLNTQPGKNIDINLDLEGATSSTIRYMGAGYEGTGSLNVSGGAVLNSDSGFLGYKSGSSGIANISGSGTKWEIVGNLSVGMGGSGQINLTGAATVNSQEANLGFDSEVNVQGAGSLLDVSHIGFLGENSTLNILDGAMVETSLLRAIDVLGSPGYINILGSGSRLDAKNIAFEGQINIDGNGALLSVGETLTLGYEEDLRTSIKLSNGAVLALSGQADSNIAAFLDLVEGNDSINYFNTVTGQWENIVDGAYGIDYELEYFSEGEMAGFTTLTVMAVPEPATIMLLAVGGTLVCRRRKG